MFCPFFPGSQEKRSTYFQTPLSNCKKDRSLGWPPESVVGSQSPKVNVQDLAKRLQTASLSHSSSANKFSFKKCK